MTPPILAPPAEGAGRRDGVRILVAFAAFVIIVSGLKAAASILVPFAMAVFVATILMPPLKGLERLGVSPWIGIPSTLLLALAILFAFGTLAIESLTEIQAALPRYIDRLQAIETDALRFLTDRGVPIEGGVLGQVLDRNRAIELVGGTLRGIATFTSSLFIIMLIAVFLLAEAAGLPRKLRTVAGGEDTGRLRRAASEVQRYLGIKSVISALTGLLVGLWCAVWGLDFPLFWGLTAFLFNYIPSVGSVIAAVPAVFLALVQLGTGGALVIGAGYLGVNTLLGNLIEPAVLGRGLGLSPVVVILSLLFWGYVWGPLGMLLSLPLTMIAKLLMEQSRDFHAIAVLLGPAAAAAEVPEPAEAS